MPALPQLLEPEYLDLIRELGISEALDATEATTRGARRIGRPAR